MATLKVKVPRKLRKILEPLEKKVMYGQLMQRNGAEAELTAGLALWDILRTEFPELDLTKATYDNNSGYMIVHIPDNEEAE